MWHAIAILQRSLISTRCTTSCSSSSSSSRASVLPMASHEQRITAQDSSAQHEHMHSNNLSVHLMIQIDVLQSSFLSYIGWSRACSSSDKQVNKQRHWPMHGLHCSRAWHLHGATCPARLIHGAASPLPPVLGRLHNWLLSDLPHITTPRRALVIQLLKCVLAAD